MTQPLDNAVTSAPTRILVCGATGQLATALVEAAEADRSISLTALGRPQLNLTDRSSVAAAMDTHPPQFIVNAAAYTAVDRAERECDAAFRLNCDGPRIIAELAAAAAVPVLHVSTDYVFDGSKASAYEENDPANPQGVYGRSKHAGELAVAAANPKHLILRTAWVYSATGQNFLKTMLKLAADRPELRVVADQHGSPTYAPDLAAAIIAAVKALVGAEANDRRWGTYHLAGAGDTTWHGFAQHIISEAANHGHRAIPVVRISTADYPTPARRPPNSRLDCTKFRNVFGITLPNWTWGVKRCVGRLLQSQNNEHHNRDIR